MRRANWVLLALAFALSVGVEVPPGLVPESAWRTLQALIFAGALLHIAIFQWMAVGEARLDPPFNDLLVGGTALALVGAALFPTGLFRIVVTAGLALQLAVIALLPGSGGEWGARFAVKTILGLGILLDLSVSLITAGLSPAVEVWLGPDEGLRLRFLRLARAACAALPVLVLLFNDLPHPATRFWSTGRRALLVGMVAMPAVLLAAGVIHPLAKYALPIPAWALIGGAAVAVSLAWRAGLRMGAWGWGIVLASMGVGLLAGGYAFDGPLAAPAGMTSYSDPLRVLIRLAHAYTVLVGITLIWAGRSIKPSTEAEAR